MKRNYQAENAFYKSQATINNNNCQIHSPNRFYTSGVSANSPTKIPSNGCQLGMYTSSKNANPKEKAIDSLSMLSNARISANHQKQLLSHNKSGESVRWQSPSKNYASVQGYKSIIEEIHEQNDKTLEQLDEQLKRIKSNLTKVSHQNVQQKEFSQYQTLHEEIQMLEEENERLREKNMELIEEKKKYTQQIQQYESIIQYGKIKHKAEISMKQVHDDRNCSNLTEVKRQKKQLQQLLKDKTLECEQLKKTNENFSKLKSLLEKKQAMQAEEKNSSIRKIADLEQQIREIRLSLQSKLSHQLKTKDQYYLKIIQNIKANHNLELTKYTNTYSQFNNSLNESAFRQKQSQISQLRSQVKRICKNEQQYKQQIEGLKQNQRCLSTKIEMLNNQIQLLTFSYNETTNQNNEKDNELLNLKQKFNFVEDRYKTVIAEMKGIELKCKQENNRCSMLQELCSRLERQSQSSEKKNQQYLANFKHSLVNYQKQINFVKLQNESLKQSNLQLENQINELSKQNQKLQQQNRRKCQEIMVLKRQHLGFMNEQKQARLQTYYSPQRKERERTERIRPIAQSNTNVLKYSERQKQQLQKMRQMEKEFDKIINEFKLQSQRQRKDFKEKQTKLKDTINTQKKKIDSLTIKQNDLKKELEKILFEKMNKLEQFNEIIRKKEENIQQLQRKQTQMNLKLTYLQATNKQLDQERNQLKNMRLNKETVKFQEKEKIEKIRVEVEQILYYIAKQIKQIIQSPFEEKKIKIIETFATTKQLNSISTIHIISQIMFQLFSLRQSYVKIKRKNKELEQYKQSVVNPKLQDPSSQKNVRITEDTSLSTIFQIKNENIDKYLSKNRDREEEERKTMISKYYELEEKYAHQCKKQKEIIQNLQECQQQLKQLKREKAKLKEDNQILDDDNKQKQKKIKIIEQIMLKKSEKEQIYEQRERQLLSYLTPTKDQKINFIMHENLLGESKQINIRSRIRSARNILSPSKFDGQFQIKKQMQSKVIRLQLTNSTIKRENQQLLERIDSLKKQKRDLQLKNRKYQQKSQEKTNEVIELVDNLEQAKKQRLCYENRIKHMQQEMNILVQQVEKLTNQNQQEYNKFMHQKQIFEKYKREWNCEKQIVERTHKKQFIEKDSKLMSFVQRHQIEILELNSQLNTYKQKLNKSQLVIRNMKIKLEKQQTQMSKKQEKILENTSMIRQLQEKLKEEQKEKEKMLQVFSNNTRKLTKVLEQKQIEIQQLKFIQESTVINMVTLENIKKQQGRKNQNDSIYSFQIDE